MPYIEAAGLSERFGASEMARFATEAIAVAIRDVSAVMDSKLIARFDLKDLDPSKTPEADRTDETPDAVPDLLQYIAADLVRARLYDDAPTGIVTTRAKAAAAMLAQLETGQAVLPGVEPDYYKPPYTGNTIVYEEYYYGDVGSEGYYRGDLERRGGR